MFLSVCKLHETIRSERSINPARKQNCTRDKTTLTSRWMYRGMQTTRLSSFFFFFFLRSQRAWSRVTRFRRSFGTAVRDIDRSPAWSVLRYTGYVLYDAPLSIDYETQSIVSMSGNSLFVHISAHKYVLGLPCFLLSDFRFSFRFQINLSAFLI